MRKSFFRGKKLCGILAVWSRCISATVALSAFSYLRGCSQTFIFTLVKPSPHSFSPSRVSFLRYTSKVALSAASFNHRWPSLVSRTSTLKSEIVEFIRSFSFPIFPSENYETGEMGNKSEIFRWYRKFISSLLF